MSKPGEAKKAWQPLLPPGRHLMTVHDLERLTVTPFAGSTTRVGIFAEFRRLMVDLQAHDLVGEVWVDGSFLTEKLDPDDIDLSFGFHPDRMDAQTPEAQSFVVNMLNGNKTYSPFIDSYICVMFPQGDPRHGANTEDYWAEKWLNGWDDRLKGFVVIKLGESDLWFNLYAH